MSLVWLVPSKPTMKQRMSRCGGLQSSPIPKAVDFPAALAVRARRHALGRTQRLHLKDWPPGLNSGNAPSYLLNEGTNTAKPRRWGRMAGTPGLGLSMPVTEAPGAERCECSLN